MSLLRTLLDTITKENVASAAQLARRLNVSQELVELMLADLERAGYLQAVTGDCGGCPGCGPHSTCSPSRPRLWVRTEK